MSGQAGARPAASSIRSCWIFPSARGFQVTGINYKDKPENALRFLGQLGNPFSAVGIDPKGSAVIDWGVYGVPETFIVNADGTIAHKHVGPLTPESLEKRFLPALEAAMAKAGG